MSIVDRVNDAQCVALITADHGLAARQARCRSKRNCDDRDGSGRRRSSTAIVAKRIGDDGLHARRAATTGGTRSSPDQPARRASPNAMNAEDLLFLLYTSGTTAKPKGIKHTTGGYLTQVPMTHKLVFDLKDGPRRLLVHRRHRLGDRPLLHRLRTAGQRRDQRALRRHAGFSRQGSLLGDRRALQGDDSLHRADGDPHVHEVGHASIADKHDLSSLRLLGTVGEPINPEAWMWYREYIGGESRARSSIRGGKPKPAAS